LKGLISAEGEAVPGKEYWDPQECVMKKAECPKEVRQLEDRHYEDTSHV
jgi:hypothetical protein